MAGRKVRISLHKCERWTVEVKPVLGKNGWGGGQGHLVKCIDGASISCASLTDVRGSGSGPQHCPHYSRSTPEPVLGVVSVLQPWRLVHEEAAIAAAQLAQYRQGLGRGGGGAQDSDKAMLALMKQSGPAQTNS